MADWHVMEPMVQINPPSEVWAANPSYLLVEVVFFVLFALCTAHSFGNAPKASVAWWAALFGGALVELVSILNKQIGNFYHSQATVMLFGNREPLYMILALYVWVQYSVVQVTLSRKFANRWIEAAFAALFGTIFWAPIDLVGLKYLWWTWHTHDPLYHDRDFGVPSASTFWLMASLWALSLVVSYAPDVRGVRAMLLGAFLGPLATVVLMNVPFMLVFHPLVTFAGLPAGCAVWAFRGACLLPFIPFRRFRLPSFIGVEGQCIFLHLFLLSVLLVFDPTAVVRTSYSQPYGDSAETESFLWGAFDRRKFINASDVIPERDQYTMNCTTPPPAGEDWYTVCGTNVFRDILIRVCTAYLALMVFTMCIDHSAKGHVKQD